MSKWKFVTASRVCVRDYKGCWCELMGVGSCLHVKLWGWMDWDQPHMCVNSFFLPVFPVNSLFSKFNFCPLSLCIDQNSGLFLYGSSTLTLGTKSLFFFYFLFCTSCILIEDFGALHFVVLFYFFLRIPPWIFFFFLYLVCVKTEATS